MHKCHRHACVIVGCIICLVGVCAFLLCWWCGSSPLAVCDWPGRTVLARLPPVTVAAAVCTAVVWVLLTTYAWCSAVVTAPAHTRCLATHSKCAAVYRPTLMLASPAWPSHTILPTCHAADVICYTRACTHSRWTTSGWQQDVASPPPPRGALADISCCLLLSAYR